MRNIGIFAHVDAGKTTLSEQLLAHAGAIRKTGSVDAGTAHTDDLPVEQRRGISVKATCVALEHRGVCIHLIDTPGHVDFSAEVERSLWALDGAVLVVCAVEGVQPQTETLFAALREQNIPTVFFVNKTDREGADPDRVLAQIHRLLTADAVFADDVDAVTEALCGHDENLMQRYFDDDLPPEEEIAERFHALCRKGEIFPVLCGSALRDRGIEPVLDAIVDCLPAPGNGGSGLCGVVFAAKQDRVLGRGAWVRLYGGQLENRAAVELPGAEDPLTGEQTRVQRKITQIRSVSGEDMGILRAGDIGVVYGLGDVRVGEVLGDGALLPRRVEAGRLRVPLMTVQVIPEKSEEMQALRTACEALTREDPLLGMRYSKTTGELQMQVMGTVQLEIIEEMLRDQYGLKVSFGAPTVIYRETMAQTAQGFVAYTMPKPCWAVLDFTMEPLPRGSGVEFVSVVPEREIQTRYQNQVRQALSVALRQGRLGWQVTDIRITLVGGSQHQWHTHPLDFIVATPMAIQDGLRRGGSVLLEPILGIQFILPPECIGRVMSDVALMRGEVTGSVTDGERVRMQALVPVSECMDYAQTLASVTSGRGMMTTRLHGYRECPLELGKSAPRRSVDPLDMSKYILAARSALEGGIWGEE